MTDEIISGNNSNEEDELVIVSTSSLRQPEAITKICLIISLLRKAHLTRMSQTHLKVLSQIFMLEFVIFYFNKCPLD